MNYLVHLFLVGDDAEQQVGSLMGDFVKGRVPDTYPPGIRLGLQHHRRVDSYALTSPFCRNSRQRLHARFGHVRGVMVDIFYDHFLAASWDDYHPRPLERFAADVYRALDDQAPWLPEGLAHIVPRMKERNWLVAYREKTAVERALRHLATRLSRPTPLGEGMTELNRHERELYGDFDGFMQAARAEVGAAVS